MMSTPASTLISILASTPATLAATGPMPAVEQMFSLGTMVLPTSLCLAAAAVVINLWLGLRIGQLRHAKKVWIGDGADEKLYARMRAQANFIENTPVFLVLVALVELAGKGGAWLPVVGALFMLGRVAHAFGMDGNFKAGRPLGMATAYAGSIGLSVVAVLAAIGKF